MSSDEREFGYAEGRRMTIVRLLHHFAGELYASSEGTKLTPDARLAFLEAERLETISALRELCAEFGCNDWPDGLHLRDVVEKHLARAVRRTPK